MSSKNTLISSQTTNGEKTSVLLVAAAIASVSSAILTIVLVYKRHHSISMERLKDQLTNLRLEERRGRIRAEIRLRDAMKQNRIQRQICEEEKVADENMLNMEDNKDIGSACTSAKGRIKNGTKMEEEIMILKQIGTIVSPFTKRMGTPRQGSVAPHARGYVQLLNKVAPSQCLVGLDQYSHAWILFEFHANTNTAANRTKIKPPRGGGIKVGTLATRSPHRPNAIGLSLVQVIGLDPEKNILKIAALDLVNGTPVYDIKPFVPWDTPSSWIVPDWVSQDDTIHKVTFEKAAQEQLHYSVSQGHLAPLYTVQNCGLEDSLMAISEILSQDPRSSKKRGTEEKVIPYRMIFCSVQIEFIVYEDSISVVSVLHVDLNSAETAEGLPLATTGIMVC